MRRVLGDPAGQGEFESQGYVTVPILSPAELDNWSNAVQNLELDRDLEAGGNSSVWFTPADPNIERRRQTERLLRPLFDEHIQPLLPDFRFNTGICVIKPPGSTGFGWHADGGLTSDRAQVGVTIWLPLTDPGPHTLRVLAGSHRFTREMGTPVPFGFFAGFADELDRRSCKAAIKPGEAILLDSGLVHRSVANQSSHAMVAIQVTAIPVDATSVFWHRASETSYELIEAGSGFWTDNDLRQDAERQPQWRSLGFVDDPGQRAWEREFRLLLDADEPSSRGGLPWHSLRRLGR
jgi:Phytanoyl-CoA dioxygenase (PhyH)